MITVSLKRSEKPEFVKNITAYLSRKYPSHVLSSHAAALAAFGELSAAFRNIQNGTGEDCKETSIRYYSELVLLENHFPFGRGPDEIQVEFVWYDSFRVKKLKKCSSYYLSLEKAGILFNIGAIQSQLATGTRDLKTQKYLFEAAAGVFAHLRDSVLPELKNLTSGPTPDITYESLSGIVFLMLANAQACYYERAWTDNKSAATLEKMACQTASYYDQALEFFSLPALAEPLEREKHPLPSMVRYYHLHYSAVAQYYKAVTIQNSNTGEAIARLQQAGNLRRQADKFAVNTSTDLPSLKQALTSINNKLTELQKDNDMFIHSPIPRFETLEPLDKKSFVKALPCSEVLNTVVAGSAQDPWSRITPVALQKTVRDYGPQVEKMMAELERQAEVNSLTLRSKKTQLNLPDCLDAAMQQGSQALPDTLIEQIGGITQEVEASPYDHLSEQLSLLKDRFQEAEEELKQAELKLIQGVNAHGDMARRLQDEMYSFRHHLRKLEDMISDLQRSFDAAAGGLEKLDMTKEELKEITMSRHFPAHRTVKFPDNVALSVAKLKNYLKILDNIERHRHDLLDTAKVRTAQFLSKLQEGNPVPFAEAFKEIEQFKGEFQTSFNSQKSALDALELEFAKFQASCPEYIRRCESQLAEFQKAVRDFRELQQRIGQGLTAASGVLSQVKSFGVRSAQASLANMRLKDAKTSSPRATVVGGPTVTGPSGAPSVQIQAPAPPPRRPTNQLPPPAPQAQGRPAPGASYLQAPTNNKPVSTGSNPDLSRYLDGPATWEIDAENVHLGQVLGQGGFGKVYEGEWLGTRVAVKELVTRLSDQDVLADFQREVRMLSALRHPNIITFYGACERGGQVLIVTEYAEEGHLRTYLQTKKPSWDQKLIIIYNILCGMKYLVSRRPPILHRDLKSYNVLMMADGKAKLADFGLARIKSESTARISAAGTPHWMAPELLRGDAPGASEKSDVFSFAVVVWEIVSEQLPWAGMIPQAVIGQVGFNNKRLPVPTDCDQYISRLISRCWVENPDHRPSFSLILDEFKQVYPQFMPTNQRSPRPSGPMHGLFPLAGAGQGQQGTRLDGSPGQSSTPLVSMVGDSNDHESVVVERPLDGKENCEQQ